MGYGKDFWNGSLTDCMNDQLKPLGLTMEELAIEADRNVFLTQADGIREVFQNLRPAQHAVFQGALPAAREGGNLQYDL